MMRKSIFLFLMLMVALGMTSQASIIWNFDTLSPATILHQGYLYVYGYTNSNGIGGSNSLEIDVPYKGVGVRGKGEGLWMSNYAGFSLNSVAPYNGTIGNTAGNLDLSVNSVAYFSIIASNTSNFGICFTMYDTTGHFFVPNGKIYLTDSTFFTNSIGSTSFQRVALNMAATHAYRGGHTTGTAPTLANIEAFELFFPCSKYAATGEGTGASELKFYVDNVGLATSAPVELWDKY